MHAYLSLTTPHEAPTQREAHLRGMYDTLTSRLDLDVPPEAIQPIVDHLVARALADWDAEFAIRSLAAGVSAC